MTPLETLAKKNLIDKNDAAPNQMAEGYPENEAQNFIGQDA